MSDGEVLLRVEHVGKKFCRSLKRSLWYGVQDILSDLNPFAGEIKPSSTDARPREVLRKNEFWAVRDVSFELRRGQCLGLIGRNGAGKTTLLKILNGLIKPDAGRIEMRGRIGALIALGAGFNPILTGLENIYVNGSVLGLRKREIDAKVDEIITFADIREFIDSPVQSYSSGMQVRLGFAIATALDPDILLLDEVLAVGDAAFRNKCYRRIVELRKNAALIFVSHSMEHVSRITDLSLVMSRGQAVYLGETSSAVREYERLNNGSEEPEGAFLSIHPPITAFSVAFSNQRLLSGETLALSVQVESSARLDKFQFRIYMYNMSGGHAAECCFEALKYGVTLSAGKSTWSIVLSSVPLKQGRYWLSFNVIDHHGDLLAWSWKEHQLEIHGGFDGALADCQLQAQQWTSSNCTTVQSDAGHT